MAFPVGAELRFAAGGLDILGECDREGPRDVTWASSAPAVAAVDASGALRALAPGRADVIARSRGVEARFPVTVVPPVARIEIQPRDTTFTVGDTVRFRAVAIGADGRPLQNAVLALRVTESLSSYLSRTGAPGLADAHLSGPGAPPLPTNVLPVRARRAASGYVVASVVGRSDSVAVRAIGR